MTHRENIGSVGFHLTDSSIAARRKICGFEVDDVSRKYVSDRGYADYFLHRTGHSIGYEVHGNGVNIDNLETRDLRSIVPGVCFSIEPGVYLPEFGVRSEIDMFVFPGRAEVTGDIQRSNRCRDPGSLMRDGVRAASELARSTNATTVKLKGGSTIGDT